jgi:RNA polymerase sigma-54 factor
MALGPRLDLRQTQSLVMTPQLQQAIKLLALSNLEIEAFIGEALDQNPLLETGEAREEFAEPFEAADPAASETPAPETSDELMLQGRGEDDAPLDIDPAALDRDRETGEWSGQFDTGGGEQVFDIEDQRDDTPSLAIHLGEQVGAETHDPQIAFVARHLIGLLDEAGYLSASLRDVALDLGARPNRGRSKDAGRMPGITGERGRPLRSLHGAADR